uniref:Uncharacterized protein n=1 Tax=Gracilaria firma TaxID=2510791 RepID=A0A1P8D6K9_9FLOR|nr:hypothetical protein [Gracilaria firma]APR74436.1 hypothetical protein [Gracilaria firma]
MHLYLLFSAESWDSLANAAIKSLGTALIVFSTTRAQSAKKFIKAQPESPSIQSSLNHSDNNRILKGGSINTAILPLRQTSAAEIDQILIEAADLESSEPNYNISETLSNTGQNVVHYFGKLITDFFFNKKRVKLSDSEIIGDVSGPTPGLTIQVQSANEVYKQSADQEKVLSVHLSLKNAARIGFLLKALKFLVYALLILKLWDFSLYMLRRILRKQSPSDAIDIDYQVINNQDAELMRKRKVYLNPANYFNQTSNKYK